MVNKDIVGEDKIIAQKLEKGKKLSARELQILQSSTEKLREKLAAKDRE